MRHIDIVQHIPYTRSKSTTHSHQKRERFLVGTRLIGSPTGGEGWGQRQDVPTSAHPSPPVGRDKSGPYASAECRRKTMKRTHLILLASVDCLY